MKRKLHLFLFVILAAFFTMGAGCQSGSLNTHQQVGIACESAAAALDTLTAAKAAGKITVDQLSDAIRIYESGVVPLCVPVAEDMTAVQRAALNAAIAELTRRAGAAQ